VILWLWNLANAGETIDYCKMRYNFSGNASHSFPGKKAVKPSSPCPKNNTKNPVSTKKPGLRAGARDTYLHAPD